MRYEEPWQLSGSAAKFYERYVRLLMEPWVRRLVAVAAPQAGEHILDVGCGTGFVARLVAERVGAKGRVVGIDLNASMVDVARATSAREAMATIEWHIGDAGALPFGYGAFDVVLCQQGVQFFPDRLRALREMRRVLRGGGRLALTVWRTRDETPYQAALADALERHVGPEAGSMARAPAALWDPRELHDLVGSAGFRNVHVRPTVETTKLPALENFVPGHLAALPIAPSLARLAPDRRAALLDDMNRALRAYWNGEQFTLPAGVNVVTADA